MTLPEERKNTIEDGPFRLSRARVAEPLEWLKNRLLNRSRRTDYIVAFLIGSVPIVLAPLIGVESSVPYGDHVYAGYHHRLNWVLFCVVLPAILFIFRWIASRLGGWTSSPTDCPRADCPPVVKLMRGYDQPPRDNRTGTNRELTAMFDKYVFGVNVFALSLVLTLLISFLDARLVGLAYACARKRNGLAWAEQAIEADCALEERDWSTMFLTGDVGFHLNLSFAIVAYLVQACAILMGVWLLLIMIRHNWYFLTCIYQRTRDGETLRDANGKNHLIVADLQDEERCFGFRPAFRAFNTQVAALLAGGLVMLVSRYFNVRDAHANAIYNAIETIMNAPGNLGVIATLAQADNVNLLPNDIGQWFLVGGWLVALSVVLMPGAVKYTPLWSLLRRRKGWMITNYLRELLPDEELDWKSQPDLSAVNRTAALFSGNSFWPAGDERAKLLFFWAFFVLLVLLFPLGFDPDAMFLQLAYWVAVTLVALLVAKVFFVLLLRPIFYMDPRLVGSGGE